MKKKILTLGLFVALLFISVGLKEQWEICTTETINCWTQQMEPAGSHLVMACGDDWQGWGDMLDDWSNILCGHGAWGLH